MFFLFANVKVTLQNTGDQIQGSTNFIELDG